jgi:hypothetical protein
MRNLVTIPEIKSPLICFTSVYLVLFVISLYVPVTIYLSDPSFFNHTLSDVVRYAVTTMLIGAAIFGFIYLCVGKKLRGKLTFIVTCLAVLALLNVLVPLRDYGSIDSYFITGEEALFGRKLLLFYDIGFILCIYVVIYILSVKNLITENKALFPLLAIVLTLFVAYMGVTSNIQYNEKEVLLSDAKLPEYNDALNSYSKDKQNVVVIMLDMFTSAHLADIFKHYPDLEKEFTGFTWYSDTTNSGSATFLSEPSIHGGFDYTVEAINARSDKIESIVDEIAKGYRVFNDNFGKNGFDISLYGTQHADCDLISEHVNNDYLKVCKEFESEYDYFSYYSDANNMIVDYSAINDNAFLQAYALMSISPYTLRPYVYGNGTWLNIVNKERFNKRQYGQYSYLASMTSISNVNSDRSTFKYIQSEIAHKPWNIDNTLQLTLDDPYPETDRLATKVDGIIPEHFYAEAYSIKVISEWVKWLKQNNIYDNTMIVLVSDHGHYDNPRLAQAFGVDTKGMRQYTENVDYPGRPSGLLFIKDFSSGEKPKESKQFMSTADVPSIVCSAIGGCDGILKDPRGIKSERSFLYSIGEANVSRHGEKTFTIDQTYEINSSIYDKENWTQVE